MNKLKEIEKRILEIEEEKPRRVHNFGEDYTGTSGEEEEADAITYLDVEKSLLEKNRQFILDRRNGWKPKILWNILVPILTAIITTYLINRFIF